MPNFLKQYSAVQEYMESVNKARENLEKMQIIVVKQFRHQDLFSKIQDIGRAYIPAGLEYRESSINYAYDWLQIVQPTRKAVHLEWLLGNNGQPGFKCEHGESIPFVFHLEIAEKQQLAQFIFTYLYEQFEKMDIKVSNNEGIIVWENALWKIIFSQHCCGKAYNMLGIVPLKPISASGIEVWLPGLLQCSPIQILLQLLMDETFWSRPEIKQLIG